MFETILLSLMITVLLIFFYRIIKNEFRIRKERKKIADKLDILLEKSNKL